MKTEIRKKLFWIVPSAVLVILIVLGTVVVCLAQSNAVPERFQGEVDGKQVADRLVATAVAGETVELSAQELALMANGMMQSRMSGGDIAIKQVNAAVTGKENEIEFCLQVEVGGRVWMLTAGTEMVAEMEQDSVSGVTIKVQSLKLGKLPLSVAPVMKLAASYAAEMLPDGMTVSGKEISFSLAEFSEMIEEFTVTEKGVRIRIPGYIEGLTKKLAEKWHLDPDSFLMKMITGFMQGQVSGDIQTVEDAQKMLEQWEEKAESPLLKPYVGPILEESRQKLELLMEMVGYRVA